MQKEKFAGLFFSQRVLRTFVLAIIYSEFLHPLNLKIMHYFKTSSYVGKQLINSLAMNLQ